MAGSIDRSKRPGGRGRRLILPFRVLTGACFLLALAGMHRSAAGMWFGVAGVALVIGAPVGRVGFLAVRWWRMADRAFALRAALLACVAVGVLCFAVVGR